MKNSRGVSLVASLLSVVGLVGLGVGGFNLVKTGCPLGGCSSAATTATLTTVADRSGNTDGAKTDGGCPMSGGCSSSTTACSSTTVLPAVAQTVEVKNTEAKGTCEFAKDCSAECRAACESGGSDCESKDACAEAKTATATPAASDKQPG
jgi:hypothetical protein